MGHLWLWTCHALICQSLYESRRCDLLAHMHTQHIQQWFLVACPVRSQFNRMGREVFKSRAFKELQWVWLKCYRQTSNIRRTLVGNKDVDKQRVLMHGHQGWNVRHGLCHICMIYVYVWVVYSFCLFCCLFIIVTTQFVALYKPCKPKPKP